MALVDRVKNILLTPKTEWDVIAAEATPTASLITGYVLPLAGVAALATFIGYCLVGTTLPFVGTYRMSIPWGIGFAVWHLVAAVIAVLNNPASLMALIQCGQTSGRFSSPMFPGPAP